jgi:RNA polymerase sigma-70 factor (ECF subfamily)
MTEPMLSSAAVLDVADSSGIVRRAAAALPLDSLAERAAAGDDRAATELVRTLAPAAARIVRGLGVAPAARDDLVQEALVAFVRALSRFEGRSSVETYLYGICVRIVRHHRRATARFLRALERLVETAHEPAENRVDLAETDERARAVTRLLDRLPHKRREVLVLYEMEGRSAAEIARILEIPEATVYTRLYHARRAFRRLAERAPELREEVK